MLRKIEDSSSKIILDQLKIFPLSEEKISKPPSPEQTSDILTSLMSKVEVSGSISTEKHEWFGLMGGTFDPPHEGHSMIAMAAIKAVGLNGVRVIPCYNPSHKKTRTDAEDRLTMARLATAHDKRLVVDDIEYKLGTASRTIDMLDGLLKPYATDINSKKPVFCLIMGMDSLIDFPKWKQPDQILEKVHLLVARRPGCKEEVPASLAEREVKHVNDLQNYKSGRIFIFEAPLLDISSTMIREDLASGKKNRYISKEVYDYVCKKGLYGNKHHTVTTSSATPVLTHRL